MQSSAYVIQLKVLSIEMCQTVDPLDKRLPFMEGLPLNYVSKYF